MADDPALLAVVLDSVIFFEQLQQTYAFATDEFESTAGHPPLKAVLQAQADRFKQAMVRTIQGPCPERRSEWDTDEGEVYRQKSSWFEDRVAFLLGLTPPWSPSDSWFAGLLTELVRRWNDGLGWKSEAVDLMRTLTAAAGSAESTMSVPSDVVEQMGRALDQWLPKVLEDTESDWTPYLNRLRRDQRVVLARETVLAARFESFAREELWRWSPSPPAIEELREFTEEFGLGELLQTIDEKMAKDKERDGETVSKLEGQPRSTASDSVDDRESDQALAQLFRRLAQVPRAGDAEE
jgi:hypothetical protein